MIYNINKFWHYLLGRKFVFHVDYATLLYLVSKQSLTGKLARWMLPLTRILIQDRPGTQHPVADYLSLIEKGESAVKGDMMTFRTTEFFFSIKICSIGIKINNAKGNLQIVHNSFHSISIYRKKRDQIMMAFVMASKKHHVAANIGWMWFHIY